LKNSLAAQWYTDALGTSPHFLTTTQSNEGCALNVLSRPLKLLSLPQTALVLHQGAALVLAVP
jgi:hypothetical protein